MLIAWLAAFVFAFAALGAGANGVGSIIGGSTVLRHYLLRVGYQATVTDAYLSALMLIAGLAAAVYSTSAVLRLRTEETGNLAEPVLSAATGRIRWALSHISVAVGGACLLLAAAGLSAGLGYGVLTGSVSTQVPRLLGAALARLPAVHPGPQGARRDRVGGIAALALRRRADDQRGRPDRTAAPRPRGPGPLPPGQRGP